MGQAPDTALTHLILNTTTLSSHKVKLTLPILIGNVHIVRENDQGKEAKNVLDGAWRVAGCHGGCSGQRKQSTDGLDGS